MKELHDSNVLKYLHSCLKEIIQNALDRYKQYGYLANSTITLASDTRVTYLTAPAECKAEVRDLLQVLKSHHTISESEFSVLSEEIAKCIQRSQDGQSPSAKL